MDWGLGLLLSGEEEETGKSRFIGVKIRQSAEKKKGTVDGFFKVNLAGGVYFALYKSRLYTKRHLWTGFSAQVFRDRVDNRPNPRDLYMESLFC